MADFKVVGKLVIDDKGQLKVLGKKAKGASQQLDKVGTSAQTADRRLKGAAQASSGGTKNFSKMAQGINGGLVPAYATLAASLFAIGALFRGLEEAANIKNQTKGMEIFGEATGIAMKGIVSDLRAATGGMLDFRNAAQQAQIATAAGFSADQIKQLGKGAKLASVALGRDLTDSFNRLLRGVTKAEPELLDELGIILRIDDATRKYAQANDLVASKLTISQRRAAVFEEVSRQLANNFGDFEEGADTALNAFSKVKIAFSDILDDLARFAPLMVPLETIANFLAANTGAAALLFAGFASSIMKSAFPALTNMTAALKGYKATSESSLRAEKVKFTQYGVMFKKNAADARLAELKKSATFKKFLKKRGMDETAFNAKSVTNQRRSISLMIANLQKRAAAGKTINDAELAYFIKTRNQMVAVQGFSFAKMTGIAKAGALAVGNAVGAAITIPALLARLGLAKIGAAALALAPIFATLGAVISGAFTIFTVGFIAKFLYELIPAVKQEKEEREKVKKVLDASYEKLVEIDRISTSITDKVAEGATKTIDGMNKSLLKTYQVIKSLEGEEMVKNFKSKITYDPMPSMKPMTGSESAELASQIMGQITALSGLNALPEGIAQQFGNLSQGQAGTGSFAFLNTMLQSNINKGTVGENAEGIQKTLAKALSGDFEGEKLLLILELLNNTTKKIAQPGEGLYNVNEAAKTVKDTLATIGDGYKPTTFDTLSTQLTQLETDLHVAIKDNKDAGYYKKVGEQLGMTFKDNEAAIAFVEARALAVREIIAENARGLLAKSQLAAGTASYGSRKNQMAVFAKEKLKEMTYLEDILALNNNIREEEEIQILRKRNGEEIDNRKLRGLEQQLALVRAQSDEYARANTIAGKLQDTFADGIGTMFQSIIDGSASARDALKQLAIVVIQEIQKIAAAKMAAGIIASLTDVFPSFGGGTSAPKTSSRGGAPMRYGGVVGNKGYASGGIADGPSSGYNVLMHGREAIVPLPDGDKIPVQLTGKGQGPVNSVINVTVNNEGDVETSAEESTALGEAIQMAVTREISEQQRPGGLLSPI